MSKAEFRSFLLVYLSCVIFVWVVNTVVIPLLAMTPIFLNLERPERVITIACNIIGLVDNLAIGLWLWKKESRGGNSGAIWFLLGLFSNLWAIALYMIINLYDSIQPKLHREHQLELKE